MQKIILKFRSDTIDNWRKVEEHIPRKGEIIGMIDEQDFRNSRWYVGDGETNIGIFLYGYDPLSLEDAIFKYNGKCYTKEGIQVSFDLNAPIKIPTEEDFCYLG